MVLWVKQPACFEAYKTFHKPHMALKRLIKAKWMDVIQLNAEFEPCLQLPSSVFLLWIALLQALLLVPCVRCSLFFLFAAALSEAFCSASEADPLLTSSEKYSVSPFRSRQARKRAVHQAFIRIIYTCSFWILLLYTFAALCFDSYTWDMNMSNSTRVSLHTSVILRHVRRSQGDVVNT